MISHFLTHRNSCLQIDAYNAVYFQHTRDLIKSACFSGSMNGLQGPFRWGFFITDCPHVELVWEAVLHCGVFCHLCLLHGQSTLPKVTEKVSLDKLLIAKPLLAETLWLLINGSTFSDGDKCYDTSHTACALAEWKLQRLPRPRRCPAAILASLLRNRNQCHPVRQR